MYATCRSKKKGKHTGVATHTTSGTSRSEENDCITQELDVCKECRSLAVGKRGLRRVELEPVIEIAKSATAIWLGSTGETLTF